AQKKSASSRARKNSLVCPLRRRLPGNGPRAASHHHGRATASAPATPRQLPGFLCDLSAANDLSGGIGHPVSLGLERPAHLDSWAGIFLIGSDLGRNRGLPKQAPLAAGGLALVSG